MIAAVKRGRLTAPAWHRGRRADGCSRRPFHSCRSAAAGDNEEDPDQVIIDSGVGSRGCCPSFLLNSTEFYAGSTVRAASRGEEGASAESDVAAAIEVKVISTIEPPRVIFAANTADGTAVVRCEIPPSPNRRPSSSPPRVRSE
jgi:hypothetical protein